MTTFFQALTALAAALAGWLHWREKNEIYDLIAKSEARQIMMRTDIEQLRNQRTEAAAQEADVLFQQLQKEKAKYEKYLDSL